MRTPLLALAMAALMASCGGGPARDMPSPGAGEVLLKVTAGPTCPVETMPPQPGCEPHAVQRAVIELDGPTDIRIVVRGGEATVDVPAGMYQVVPRPVPGLMGAPTPTTVKVVAGRVTTVKLSYDTGIR